MDTPNPGADDAPVSHQEAADKFFAAPTKPAEKPAGETKPTPEAKPTVTETKQPVVPQLIKTKSTEAAKPAESAPSQVTPPDFDKLVGPDEKSKHRADWDKMKAATSEHYKARTAAEQKLADLEKKLQARGPEQADEATKARIQQLESQIKSYDEKLKVYDLQSHPDFVKQYVEPKNNAVKSIKDALELEGVKSADVDQILTLEGKAFVDAVSKLLPELSEFNRQSVAQAFREAKNLSNAAKQALGNVDQLRQQYQQNFAARSRAAFDNVGKQFQDTLVAAEVPENATEEQKQEIATYNAELAALNKRAEALAFGETNEESVSAMAHKAVRLDFMANHALPRMFAAFNGAIASRDAQIEQMSAQIKELTAANPQLKGGAGEGDGGGEKKAPTSHLEAAQGYFAS